MVKTKSLAVLMAAILFSVLANVGISAHADEVDDIIHDLQECEPNAINPCTY